MSQPIFEELQENIVTTQQNKDNFQHLVCLICNKHTYQTEKHQCEFRKITQNLVVRNEQ